MVLISITSDPYDFLSAHPPSLYSRQSSVIRPVLANNGRQSNGNRTGNNDGATGHVTTAPPPGSQRVTGYRQSRGQADHNNTSSHSSAAAKIKLSEYVQKFSNLPETIVTEPESDNDAGAEKPCREEYEEFKTNLFDAIKGAENINLEKETKTMPPLVIAPAPAILEEETINEGITVLMGACQQGLEHDVRSILRRKPNSVRQVDRTGKSAVHYCAENQNITCLEQVLEVAPSLMEEGDNEGYTPLHLAVIAGNTNIIRYLLSKKANVNALDKEHHSPVHWAVVCGQLEPLDVLCNSGSLINTADIHGAFPIHYAAQMCGPAEDQTSDKSRVFLVVLRKLLARGADPNVEDKDQRPPVLWAASAGSADAFLALVNYGASSDKVDKDGLAALHCAASRGHKECLSILITLCGADVNQRDGNGCTALFYTVTLGYVECSELLLGCGALTDIQDRKGRTPAHCGAAKGQLDTLRLLHTHGGDLAMENNKGELPLMDAVRSGRKDLVRWWLELHEDKVDKANRDGKTALHIAAATRSVDICAILVDKKASVNKLAVNEGGKVSSPLDVAVHRGNRSCARYLVSKGGLRSSKLMSKVSVKSLPSAKNAANEPAPDDIKQLAETPLQKTRNSSKMSLNRSGTEDSDTDLEASRSQSRKRRVRRKKGCSSSNTRTPSSNNKDPLPEPVDRKFLVTPRFIKSPFQLPPRSPFDSVELQPESDPLHESSHLEEDFVFSPLQEEPVDTFENINDENFGRKMIIEKHLEHQMILKKQAEAHSPLIKQGKKKSDCSLVDENDEFSTEDYSTTLFNKGISEIYPLNNFKSRKNPTTIVDKFCTSTQQINATSKELRKVKQENFLVGELIQAREAGNRFRHCQGRVTVTAKRLIDNFNKKITTQVGCKTYTGPISFYFFEKFLMDELTKLNITLSSSHFFWNPKPSFSDSSKTRALSSLKSCSGGRLILPQLTSAVRSTPDTEYLEVRHGQERKLIKLPVNPANPEQSISVTFTIKPKTGGSGSQKW